MSRLLNLFYKISVNSQRTYCAETNGIPRTEWQDGWNAAIEKASEDTRTLLAWYRDMPMLTQACVLFLLDTDVLELDITDGTVDMWVQVNDFFGPCADGESITMNHLFLLANACAMYPVWGKHAVAACLRKQEPWRVSPEIQEAIDACKNLDGRSWLEPKILDSYQVYAQVPLKGKS